MLLIACAVAAQEPAVEDEAVSDEEPVAQEPVSDEEPVEMEEGETFDEPLPITTTVFLEGNSTGEQLEIVIHRWTGVLPPLEEDDEDRVPPDEEGEEVEAEPQSFVVSVSEQPSFIQNISWIDGPELVFEPGENSKTVTLVFDTAAEGESGLPEEEAELVLVIEARDDTIEPDRRELEVPIKFKRALAPEEAAVTVCALREDAPEDFPIEEAFRYCDPERVPVLKYDRAVAFVTPARDLRLPIGEDQDFALQILGPDGNRVGGLTFWNKGSEDEPEISVPFTVEGSPGRFAIPLHLWRQHRNVDPAGNMAEPAIYTVQTADVRIEGSAVFGQGEATTYIDGDWVDEGTFEISDRAFELKAFVAEQAGVVHFPYNPKLRLGSVTYGEPQIEGTRVAIDLSAEWRWHGKEAEQATSRLVFEFPERLLPGFETAGEMTASLEQLSVGTEDYAFVLTAGVHDPVATTTRPPGRRLTAAEAPIWKATRKDEIGRRHDASDGSRCDTDWVWTQGAQVSYDRRELMSGNCTFDFLGIRNARDAWGEPARDLASHLHDPETLLVIPVFYAVRGETRDNLAVNGYAVYGVGPDPYDGPPPTEKPEGGIGPAAPPILKLQEIVGNRGTTDTFEHAEGSPGFSERSDSHYLDGTLNASVTQSAQLLGLPLEIRLDEPFEAGGEVVRSVVWGPLSECAIMSGASGSLYATNLGGDFSATGSAGRSGCPPDHSDAEKFRTDPRSDDGGTASMTLQLTPVREHERSTTDVDFYFRAHATTPAGVEGSGDEEGVLFTWDYTRPTTPEGYLVPDVDLTITSGLTISLSTSQGSIRAVYGPVESPDEGLESVPPYAHPVVATTSPGDPPPGGETTPPGAEGDPQDSDTTETDDELDPTGTTGGRDGFDPKDPNTWDPDKDPDVANHIRTWLATADPPESAVAGVDFDYDEYGRMIGGGGATGRTISRHDTVDYSTGPSSEGTVWDELRTKLDSIDHCILEEYVVAKVQEGSIDHCRGRYGAVRDLGGVPLSEAKTEVTGSGFEVKLSPGQPAPSPDLEATVERQDPPPTHYLKRGQALTLVVHAPYVPPAIAAPDLVGLKRPDAKRRLEDQGLIAALRPGSPARSAQESDTVEAQEPAAGATLEPGTEVAIWVRSPYVATSTIPDLVGLSIGEARAALAAVGVDPSQIQLLPGSPAPSPTRAGTVEAQEPAAGWTVEPGRRVTLRVHSGFVDLRTVPALVGLSSGEAKRRLAALGLEVRLAPGSPAPAPNATGTVQEQSLAPGSSVSADTVVTLSIHSPWVPPPTPVPPPPTAVPPTAVPTVVTRTRQGELPLPNLQCPSFVTLRSNSDLCVGNNPNPPSVGSQLPLDRARSGYKRSTSSEQYGRPSFECYYRIEPYSKNFLFIRWTHVDYQGMGPMMSCESRTEGGRFGGNYSFYSRNHWVEAMLNGNCFNAQENEAISRRLIKQTEPFAKSCSGAGQPPPTWAPPPPTNTRVPPPPPTNTPVPPTPAGPPQCPGPSAPRIYDLWNAPPYPGLGGIVCRDGSGRMWINVSNNVYPVDRIQPGPKDPNSECWWETAVVTPRHTYGGTLCR